MVINVAADRNNGAAAICAIHLVHCRGRQQGNRHNQQGEHMGSVSGWPLGVRLSVHGVPISAELRLRIIGMCGQLVYS